MLFLTSIIVFDLLLPCGLLFWLFKTKATTRLYLASIVLLNTLYLAVVNWSILGFWWVVGTFWPVVYLVFLAAILVARLRRGKPVSWFPARWSGEFFLTGLNGLVAAAWSAAIPFLLQASIYSEEPLRISSPLRGGTFYVMTGGSNVMVNQHAAEASGKYAMDITRLNAFGLRALGLFPGDLRKYAAFGADIIAPCAGEVISAESNRPNRMPLDPDGSDTTGGNHVVLYCQEHSVHLAHMSPGTVRVAVGEQVAVGQLLGNVGTSGNSMEPHLHISAVEGRHANFRRDARLPGGVRATPLLIDGRFLIKGDNARGARP